MTTPPAPDWDDIARRTWDRMDAAQGRAEDALEQLMEVVERVLRYATEYGPEQASAKKFHRLLFADRNDDALRESMDEALFGLRLTAIMAELAIASCDTPDDALHVLIAAVMMAYTAGASTRGSEKRNPRR